MHNGSLSTPKTESTWVLTLPVVRLFPTSIHDSFLTIPCRLDTRSRLIICHPPVGMSLRCARTSQGKFSMLSRVHKNRLASAPKSFSSFYHSTSTPNPKSSQSITMARYPSLPTQQSRPVHATPAPFVNHASPA